MSTYLPCPFCGSERLRVGEFMFADDDGEKPGIECLDCDCSNRAEFWNMRGSKDDRSWQDQLATLPGAEPVALKGIG